MKGRLLAAASAAIMVPMSLRAQVIERHAPPVPVPEAAVPPPAPPSMSADDRPIGPALRGIAVLGDRPAAMSGHDGIDLSGVASPGPARLRRTLRRFLGRPLSLALVARVEAGVTRHYRAFGRPFVTVATPAQELTGGVLQVRVIEYHVGRIAIAGADADEATRLVDRIRLAPGARISSRTLGQDLDWLNRFPFRRVDARFQPGDASGATDVTLAVSRFRPWQAYGGYATSDAPSTGTSRFYAGALVGDLLGRDSVASVQATTSSPGPDPRYLSVAVQAEMPTGPRRQIELAVNAVRTHRDVAAFSTRTAVSEAALVHRFALPYGNARAGVQARWLDTETRFGGERAFGSRFAVYQVDLGYDAALALPRGQAFADIAVHASPGGIGAANTADRLFFGRPRPGSARYLYVTLSLSQRQQLLPQVGWNTELIAQMANAPLPPTEQAGLGGSFLVRGYTLDDGAFDRMVLLRNALTLSLRTNIAGRQDAALYGFVDAGVAEDIGARRTGRAASLGAGVLCPLFGFATVKLEASNSFVATGATAAGHVRLWGRLAAAL